MGPSVFHDETREVVEQMAREGRVPPPGQPPPTPDKGAPNPCLVAAAQGVPWPVSHHTAETDRRRALAAEVVAAMAGEQAGADAERGLSPQERALVATWDEEGARLLEEAMSRVSDQVGVERPSTLSATAVAAMRDDPEGFAARVARPMPRPPSPAARFGTRFHAWVEAWFDGSRQDYLVDPDEIDGRGDLEIDDDTELRDLVERFRTGPLAQRKGAVVEAPFAIVLAGQVVRGRIDAAFPDDDGGWLLVDWKTSRRHDADPLQLALYRLAWAELHQLPLDKVRAGFYYVRDAALEVVDDLPDRAELERIVGGVRSDAGCSGPERQRRVVRRRGRRRPRGQPPVARGAAPSSLRPRSTEARPIHAARGRHRRAGRPRPACLGSDRERLRGGLRAPGAWDRTGSAYRVDRGQGLATRLSSVLRRSSRHPRRGTATPRRRGPRHRGGAAEAQPSMAARATSTMWPKVSWRSSALVCSPLTMWSETVQIARARRLNFAASV